MSCRVALLKLYREGHLSLPEPGVRPWTVAQGERPTLSLPEIESLRCRLKALGEIQLVLVESKHRSLSRLWNDLMDTYHYLGAGPLCGAQVRYLIESSIYGRIGGLAFSAAAWRVAPRDRWIGWSEEARKANVAKVVCNSRFLLVPRVAHLASHVLSLCPQRVRRDWVERYGVRPVLLETYVERDRFKGVCYRSANWCHVGETQGRGRMDRDRAYSAPVKDVYVYPLQRDARKELCVEPPKPIQSRSREGGLAPDWAEEEFREADFGDRRLNHRVVSLAEAFYARPQANIPQACQTRAETKAAYRFLDHPETSMEKVLAPHYETTLGRISSEEIVLAVQDTTSLNYTAHPATQNLGPIGYRLDRGIGLMLHSTLAFNRAGTPLGLLDVQGWARDEKDFGKKKRRHSVPIEQKESYRWLVSFRKVAEAQKRCPKTTLVSVGDREADIYELFELALSDPSGPKLLIRAEQDRLLAESQGHLWQKMAQQEVSGIQELQVPRQKNRPARVARLEVRFAEVTLKPPQRKKDHNELALWAVWAWETEEPAEGERIEWMLLTTVPVRTFEEAIETLTWYTIRWGIEIFHKTLKSGCKVEERQLGHADRIETCLAIDMVVAWRIFHLAKLGRETPDVPCTLFFEEAEWKALVAYVTHNPKPPDDPPTLREAMRMVASLGGFLARKGDGEPGTKSLWLGLQRLDDLSSMWKLLTTTPNSHPPSSPLVSSNPGYG
jgi:Druantia protein DruA/Transposase DNA-binding/Transposase Tn5 dimerisation domain